MPSLGAARLGAVMVLPSGKEQPRPSPALSSLAGAHRGCGGASSWSGRDGDSREPARGRAEVPLRDETARPAPAARGQSSRARATAGYLGLSPHHSPPSPRLLFASPLHQSGLKISPPALKISPPATASKGQERRLVARPAAGGEMGKGGRSARGGAGGDSSGGFEGRCSPAPSSPPLQNPRSRGAWTKPCFSGTMTLARFVVALVLGALPEVIGFDLVSYPVHHRYRHSPPRGPRHPYYLPTQQRQQRTPPPPPLPRVPRPPPALHAQRLHALHAGRTPGPHHPDCPAGEPWVNVTDFGAPCLRWAEVPPFLERSPPASWAQLRGQRHNFCRSPDGAGRPWCFYGHAHGKVDWGYCDCRHGEWSRASGGSSGMAGSQPGSPRALGVP